MTTTTPGALPFPAGLSASVVTVDPATAARWLERNTNNRAIRPKVLAAYARDMSTGCWHLTGEAVKFATDGTLLDGQHRLEAVIRSGATVAMFVVSGVAAQAQEVMDTGAKRKTADALRMAGQPRAGALAAGGRVAVQFEQGTDDDDTGRPAVSNSEVITWVQANPSVHDATELAMQCRGEVPAPTGVLVYAAWKLAMIDQSAAREFLAQVARLDNIPSSDPRWVLHHKLHRMRAQKTVDTSAGYLDLFFQAWNRWREGRTATLFRVARDKRGQVVLTEPH